MFDSGEKDIPHIHQEFFLATQLIVLNTYVSAWSIVQKPHWLYIESILMLDIFIEMSVEHAVIFNKKDLKLFSADA